MQCMCLICGVLKSRSVSICTCYFSFWRLHEKIEFVKVSAISLPFLTLSMDKMLLRLVKWKNIERTNQLIYFISGLFNWQYINYSNMFLTCLTIMGSIWMCKTPDFLNHLSNYKYNDKLTRFQKVNPFVIKVYTVYKEVLICVSLFPKMENFI